MTQASKRLEEDGVFLEPSEHWEMWEAKVYVYKRKDRGLQAKTVVPIDIVRHLKLANKEKVMLAIRILKPHPEPVLERKPPPKRTRRCEEKSLVPLCNFDGYCPFRKHRNSGGGHRYKKSRCKWKGSCNQKSWEWW